MVDLSQFGVSPKDDLVFGSFRVYPAVMKPLLALLSMLFVPAAFAGDPAPAAAPAEESHFYAHALKASWWGDVVSRRDISLNDDLPNLSELCFIPPAADWVTDGATPEVELKYLRLIWRVAYSLGDAQGTGNLGGKTIGSCGVNAYAVLTGIGAFNNFFVGAMDADAKARTRFTSCMSTRDFVKGAPKYSSSRKKIVTAAHPVMDTLNLLAKSKNPETALEALSLMRVIAPSDKYRDTIEAVVRDKTVTATITIKPDGYKETMPLRVYAMRTLATLERTERTAKILALIWHDEKEPEDIRVGALRSFAFITEWAGPALVAQKNRPVMHKTLYSFLAPMMMMYAVENDKKEEAGSKAQLSALGQAAECAVNTWPKKIQLKARKGKKFDDPD